MEAKFINPWFVHTNFSAGRHTAPSANMEEYARDQCHDVAEAMLSLHLNYTLTQKRNLFVYLVQLGIDIYGSVVAGNRFRGQGGLDSGRKNPLVLAALALNDTGMLSWSDRQQRNIFHEDRQTFIVDEGDVGRSVIAPRLPYGPGDDGLPEWGEAHTVNPARDDSRWGAAYRTNNACNCGAALATLMLTGGREAWNWEPYFLYYAGRYWFEQGGGTVSDQRNSAPNRITPFAFNMLKAYRNTYLTYPASP